MFVNVTMLVKVVNNSTKAELCVSTMLHLTVKDLHNQIRLPTGQSCYLGLEVRHQSSFFLGNWRLNPLSITYGNREII